MKKRKYIGLILFCSLLVCCTSGTKDLGVRVAKYKDDKVCAISYTYDDGMKEHYSLVFPEMEKRNIKGTFWVNGISVNPDAENINDTGRVSWPELKEMALKGHEISNHGWSHANLAKISLDDARVEIEKNDSIILANTGIASRTFCYPYNATNKKVLKLTSEGRIGTRTKRHAFGSKSTPENLKKWVNTVMKANGWGVAMIHGINYGYDAFTSSAILWEHFDHVKAMDDFIWVGTFREVAAYTKEYENLEYETDIQQNSITITPQVTLDKDLFNEPLTMVIEKEGMQNVSAKQDGKEIAVKRLPGKTIFDFDPYGGAIVITTAVR